MGEDKKSKPSTSKGRSGIPMSEESYKEWEKAFTDMEESIDNLYKNDKDKSDNFLF